MVSPYKNYILPKRHYERRTRGTPEFYSFLGTILSPSTPTSLALSSTTMSRPWKARFHQIVGYLHSRWQALSAKVAHPVMGTTGGYRGYSKALLTPLLMAIAVGVCLIRVDHNCGLWLSCHVAETLHIWHWGNKGMKNVSMTLTKSLHAMHRFSTKHK